MALLSEGRNLWIISELAMFYAGAINVPLSIKLEEAGDLLFRLDHSDARYIIVSGNQLRKVRGIIDRLPRVERVIVLDSQAEYGPKEIFVGEVLQQGDVLAMAADRRTGDAVTMCTFMGSRAPLPEGPFRVCKAVRKPVLLVFVLKQDAHTYRVTCQELQPDKDLAQTYAQAVEQVALQHPYEWFNFYDFWA